MLTHHNNADNQPSGPEMSVTHCIGIARPGGVLATLAVLVHPDSAPEGNTPPHAPAATPPCAGIATDAHTNVRQEQRAPQWQQLERACNMIAALPMGATLTIDAYVTSVAAQLLQILTLGDDQKQLATMAVCVSSMRNTSASVSSVQLRVELC